MSLRAMVWAFDQEIPSSSDKFVLIAMANFCGETGKSFPGINSICMATSLHKDTVIKSIRKLVSDGYIKDTGKTTGDTGRVKIFEFPEECKEIGRKNRPLKREIGGEWTVNRRSIGGLTPPCINIELGTRNPNGKGFEDFWMVYPKKTGKLESQKEFSNIEDIEAVLPQMLKAIEKQKESVQWTKENGQFIPNPATWLKRGGWMDVIEVAKEDPNEVRF